MPTFDRSGVRHPKGDELISTFLRLFAPTMPMLRPPSSAPTLHTTQQSRRTFVLRADEIQTLKQQILQQMRALAGTEPAIQEAIRVYLEELGDDPLSDIERCMAVHRGIPRGRLARVGSSNRFMACETDFGWGAPTRVELVSLVETDLVTLLGAREPGAVQVSVVLDRAAMEAFAACLVVPASTSSGDE